MVTESSRLQMVLFNLQLSKTIKEMVMPKGIPQNQVTFMNVSINRMSSMDLKPRIILLEMCSFVISSMEKEKVLRRIEKGEKVTLKDKSLKMIN